MININYDGIIAIAEGRSRKETVWINKELKWSELLERLSETTYTHETAEQYRSLPKSEQDAIKDVGGFVGGTLKDRKRNNSSVLNRTLLTLDADFAQEGFWRLVADSFDYACCLYSTHKHVKDKPRLRLVIPLERAVTPEEYEAVARKVSKDIGIDYFDDTTYEPSRLMYWPSTSKDGLFEFEFKDDKWLKPEDILASYDDWRNRSLWPEASRLKSKIKRLKDKQGNPRDKKGFVGAFCRTYNVPEAIDKFLPEIYGKTLEQNRYTYMKGSTWGGLIIYEKGDFAYSHHSTDPAGGKLCNAFDLVRLHKFGHLDEGMEEKVSSAKLPSYAAMLSFVQEAEAVKITLGQERLKLVREDFQIAEGEEALEVAWLKKLEADNRGNYKPTITNIVLILENDPYIKGKIALNEFSHSTMLRGDVPWHKLENKSEGDIFSDRDDAALRQYLEKVYDISAPNKILDAVLIIEEKNKYHPIREYISSLTWDGTPRLDTLLMDYLGAEDNKYVRTVTRKALVAAVARVFKPGIKFDNTLVLVGKQGIGKSHIIRLLGQCWFSDSFTTVQGKEAYEQLQNAWLIELAELSATRKAEAEAVKQFLSKCDDSYRVAYGKRVTKFPRQCVFFGTTNDNEFLKDKTGNRRFWPIVVGLNKSKKNLWTDMNQAEIDQIWAEVLTIWRQGEKLYLEPEVEKEAQNVQESHTEHSTKEGMIREYLDMLLPSSWSTMDIGARRRYIHGCDFGETEKGALKRERVCAMEIWVELFQGDPKLMTPMQSREINDILRKLEGWKPYSNTNGKLRFGKIYGIQTAFIRLDIFED